MPQEWVDDELIVEFWLAITVLVALNNPSVKVVVKRYFDMFLRFVVLFVFTIQWRLDKEIVTQCVPISF
jgi:hypothetical protein